MDSRTTLGLTTRLSDFIPFQDCYRVFWVVLVLDGTETGVVENDEGVVGKQGEVDITGGTTPGNVRL